MFKFHPTLAMTTRPDVNLYCDIAYDPLFSLFMNMRKFMVSPYLPYTHVRLGFMTSCLQDSSSPCMILARQSLNYGTLLKVGIPCGRVYSDVDHLLSGGLHPTSSAIRSP